MKLANNFLSATALAATSEAVAFGVAHGLDMTTMIDVLNVSTGRNSATDDKFPNRILTGSYDAGFSTAHMTKDVGLFVDGAGEAATSRVTVGSAVAETWRGCDATLPGSDFTEIWRYVSKTESPGALTPPAPYRGASCQTLRVLPIEDVQSSFRGGTRSPAAR